MERISRGWKYQVTGRGSRAVETLELAWSLLRELDPRIPPAVLTLVDCRSRGRVRGYFAHSRWRKRIGAAHEVGVSPDLLGHPAELLATLLHETAHAILFETSGNGGVGSTPYYHTKAFRDQCHDLGLCCEFLNSRYGWTLTGWPAAGVPDRYRPILNRLRRDLPMGTGNFASRRVKGTDLPPSGHTMLVCACGGGRSIYVKKSVRVVGGVMCSFCKEEFRPATDR